MTSVTASEKPSRSLQMNVRIDQADKARGDAALAVMGFTPTQAVRALWSAAAGDASDLDDVNALLKRGAKRHSETQDKQGSKLASLKAGWSLYEDACARMGIDATRPHGASDDELLEQALVERYGEEARS